MKKAVFVIVWVGFGFVGWGGLNATFRHEFKRLYQDKSYSQQQSVILPMLGGPFYFVASVIFTEGFRDGFYFNTDPFPCTETEIYSRKIWCGENP